MHHLTEGQCVRLPDFILANIEPVLAEWEAFARGVWPEPASTDPAELRDHAEAILRTAVADMRADQAAAQQRDKSHGRATASAAGDRLDAASAQHGAGRVESGFRIAEVLAEYRALRASVVRLWRASKPDPDGEDLDDLTRFHESVDQSLAVAVDSFADRVDQSRRLFLAILGHDLRSPLSAIKLWGRLLAGKGRTGPDADEATASIATAADIMDRLIADLLDFTAAGLGGGMPIAPEPLDLHALCAAAAEEVRVGHPACEVVLATDGDPHGDWDPGRLRQVLTNLLNNAALHGQRAGPVRVRVGGDAASVTVAVHNFGDPIPPAAMPALFDPLRRTAALSTDRPPGRAGLGLYIAHQIVTAHGGTIDVTSAADAGTTFTVRLPRRTERPAER